MSQSIPPVRGINDILPDETPAWQWFEAIVRSTLQSYGYKEIRVPLLERTELFCRSIGEVTDIVEKEMYTFLDRNGDSLTLRPEATASCVRAGISNGLLYNQQQRLWYAGPMFRYERRRSFWFCRAGYRCRADTRFCSPVAESGTGRAASGVELTGHGAVEANLQKSAGRVFF